MKILSETLKARKQDATYAHKSRCRKVSTANKQQEIGATGVYLSTRMRRIGLKAIKEPLPKYSR
jgi:hypothetical protein